MREIKFRAWDKKSKKMRQVAWISFQDYPLRKGLPVVVQVWGWSIIEDKDILLRREINEVELLEFTGLKDKNGKEIFEGDIIKFLGRWDDNGRVLPPDYKPYIVEFLRGAFTAVPTKYERGHAANFFKEHMAVGHTDNEIIGNIYSNPELLK